MEKNICIGIMDIVSFTNTFTKDLFVDDTNYTLFFSKNDQTVIDWVKNETIDILVAPRHMFNKPDHPITNPFTLIKNLDRQIKIFVFPHLNLLQGVIGKRRDTLQSFWSFVQEFENDFNAFVKKLRVAYNNKNERSDLNLLYGKNEILTDINIVNTEWARILKINPEFIHELSSRQFEEFIAEVWDKRGYTVTLTSQTRDGGKDIYAYKKSFNCEFLFAIECKKFSPNNKVGRPIIQQLNGIVESEKLTGGILATTSYFSKDAIEYALPLKNRIFLNDINDLTDILAREF